MSATNFETKRASELARWMRKEHATVDELASALSQRVASVPRSNEQRWIDDARDAFEHFRAHMTKHIALEEQDGYMSAVTEYRPRLSDEIDRLKHEHHEILRLLDAIHELMAEIQPVDSLIIRDTCHRIQDVLRYVYHHNQSENLLVLSAFHDDIGIND